MPSTSRKPSRVDIVSLIEVESEGKCYIRPSEGPEREASQTINDPDFGANASEEGAVVWNMSDYRDDKSPFVGLELLGPEPPQDLKEHIFRVVAEEMVKNIAAPRPPALKLVLLQADMSRQRGSTPKHNPKNARRRAWLIKSAKAAKTRTLNALACLLILFLGWWCFWLTANSKPSFVREISVTSLLVVGLSLILKVPNKSKNWNGQSGGRASSNLTFVRRF